MVYITSRTFLVVGLVAILIGLIAAVFGATGMGTILILFGIMFCLLALIAR